MKSQYDKLIECFVLFQEFCENYNNLTSQVKDIRRTLNIHQDIPIIISGLLQYIFSNEPQFYWNKNVAEEIFRELNLLFKKDNDLFIESFQNSLEYFFAALNSYDYIIDCYNELYDISISEDIKTHLYRNPIYIQICENCLMNFYRTIRVILNDFSTRDYSNQNTLGKIIPILEKNNFKQATKININYRNSINHGKSVVTGENISFRYTENKSEKIETIPLYEFDYTIEKTLDISSGILVGFLKLFSVNNEILISCMQNEENESILFEWFKLLFRSNNTKIIYLNKVSSESHFKH